MTELLKLDPVTHAKFWARVSLPSPSQCWLWTGANTPDGYGRFHIGGKMVGPHRLTYEMFIGPIPISRHGKRVCLDHICRQPACVNPLHLRPFTWSENALREFENNTHCPKGHAYEPNNRLKGEARGRGSCKTCLRIRNHNRYWEKKRRGDSHTNA